MKNQFDHLTRKPKSKAAFIEGAEKIDSSKKAKKNANKDNLKLVMSGQLSRDECGKPILVHLKQEILNDIDLYCQGNKQAILNYLVKLGLSSLKEQGELVVEEVFREPPIRNSGYGQNIRYGEKMTLNKPETHAPPDEETKSQMVTAKGRVCDVYIQAWYNMRIREKNQIPLHEYPFTMVKISIIDTNTGELVFKKPLWLMALGERRDELSLLQIYECYRRRYDIEHFFRFGKQKLLMDKHQTPNTQREENWWQITILAYAQLFMAREIAEKQCKPWEKYLPGKTDKDRKCSASEVQQWLGNLLAEIGTPAKISKKRGISPGRAKGQLQKKRQRHPVIKKTGVHTEKIAA